jgi:hypothetical protein
MRIQPIALTSLFVALPAFAQAPAPAKPDTAAAAPEAAPAAASETPAPSPATAPAPEAADSTTTEAAVSGQATVTGDTAAASGVVSGAAATGSPSARGNEAAIKGAEWEMEFHGYLRAPMRVGLGKRDNPLEGQSSTTYHYPVLPDDQYLSWQFTSHNKKDWAEVFLSYGTPYAKGVVAMQGFNFTDASWNLSNAQFGISQGYVHLTPDLGYENFRLEAKAGAFWARYGLAGKWDAGEYDTYLFGRTHVMGALSRVEFDVDDANMLWFEAGVGAKRPNPTQFNNARFTLLAHGHVGLRLGMGIELSGHYMHAFAKEEDRIVQPPNPPPMGGEPSPYRAPNYPSSVMGAKDGSLATMGVDARMELGAFGFAYLGFSHIKAKEALVIAPAIEVLHAYGGGEFQNGVTDNYLGPSCRGISNPTLNSGPFLTNRESPKNAAPDTAAVPGCSRGNGSVNSVLAQWEFSLQNFLQQSAGGQKFWGDGQDLKATLYGMFNKVSSDVPLYDGNTKLKYGADVQAQIMPWLTFATRFDRVQPNSDIAEQSFAILSPRLVFKSTFNTREQISIQYSRYFYSQRECRAGVNPAFNTSDGGDANTTAAAMPYVGYAYHPDQLNCVQPPTAPSSPEGFGAHHENLDPQTRGSTTTRPDVNVFKIEASMWW